MRWQREALGSDFLPSGGRLLASDSERVFIASGPGDAGVGEPRRTVTAVDRADGATRWTISRVGPPFLHGVVGNVLIVSEQYHVIAGLDAATGAERWAISLEAENLPGYGATIGVAAEGMIALGLSASSEGNTQPPVVVSLDPATGALQWRATLTTGTDLNFGKPAVIDGAAVFLSTPSHPGSAPGNVAHAVNLRDGSVRWTLDLGGGQGFHVAGAVATPGGVHVPGPGAVLTVDPGTGSVRWRRDSSPVPTVAAVGNKLWLLEPNRVVLLDPQSGIEVANSPLDQPMLGPSALLTSPDAPSVIAVDQRRGIGMDRLDASTLWSRTWPATLNDIPIIAQDLLIVAAIDSAVTAYELPR